MTDIEKRAIDYQNQFKVYNKACNYLINRGFTHDRTRDYIIKNNRLGVSIYDKNDYYYGYLVFPVLNKDNKVMSFTGRSLLEDIKPTHKHWRGIIDYFYNHRSITKTNKIIITESPIDTLSLRNIGVHSIATMGSNLPRLNSDLTGKHVTILFDTDLNNAGQSKAKLLASKLHSVCSSIHIGHISLPSELKKIDVNDLFQQDKKDPHKHKFIEQINHILDKAKEYVYVEPIKPNYTSNHDFSGYDILDIVSEHVDLQQIGGLYRAYCPFHNDSDPSFTVYPQTSSFYCFGCEKGGDAAAFLQEIMGFEFKEAKEYLEINY